jgi:hypothetical protein
MASNSYSHWRLTRCHVLDEMATAHAAVGGSARGRRFATQQINRAYAVLLASQFQGFCRDLHSECVDHLVSVVSSPPLKSIVKACLLAGRQLDRGNAQPSSLGADFRRLDLEFWDELLLLDARSTAWKSDLDMLNEWRNAIVHEDFTSAKLGGIMTLRLIQVRRWRRSLSRLARAMDALTFSHMQAKTGNAPW